MSEIGKERRLSRLTNGGPGCAMLVRPNSGAFAMSELARQAIASGATGLVVSQEFAVKHAEVLIETPLAMSLSTGTMRQSNGTSETFADISKAATLADMSAVIVPYDHGSIHEAKMLQNLGSLISACDILGMPVIADIQVIPKGTDLCRASEALSALDPNERARLVRHGARVATELGAAAVAVPHTGTIKSFSTVVGGASLYRPVFAKNQPGVTAEQNLQLAQHAVQAGAAGVLFNSSAFEHTPVEAMTHAIQILLSLEAA